MNSINPTWVYEGQIVWVNARLAGIDCKPGTGLKCTVIAAHGMHGRVINEKYNLNKLLSIWDMWIPKDPSKPIGAKST